MKTFSDVTVLVSALCALTSDDQAVADDILIVYVGAHPDDIEYLMSGSLYKHDFGVRPILCIGVTDGGADLAEYRYELSKGWLQEDAQFNYPWITPDGNSINRGFYSADLARKRVGGYFSGSRWIAEPAEHKSVFGVAYDWITRMERFIGCEYKQLSYPDPDDSDAHFLYPDGGMAQAEAVYTEQLAGDLADTISEFVRIKGYQTDILYIASHAPAEVATNTGEHPDHKITGNAVRQAINLLQNEHGFGKIIVRWYTAGRIQPKAGYDRTDINIFNVSRKKSSLLQVSWETDYLTVRSRFRRFLKTTRPPLLESYINESFTGLR